MSKRKLIAKMCCLLTSVAIPFCLAACDIISGTKPKNTPTNNTKTPRPTTTMENKIPDGVHFAGLEWGNTMVISLTKDGEQLISGENNWYFDIDKMAEIVNQNAKATLYSLDNMYDSNKNNSMKTTIYGNLASNCTVDFKIDWLAISGDWNPFPVKVKHQSYSIENQPQNEEWVSHFSALLKKSFPGTPVIITDVWIFDIDGDGKDEALVQANNTIISQDDTVPNPPASDKTCVYSFSTLFSKSLGVIELQNEGLSKVAREFSDDISNAYTKPTGTEYYEQFVTAIQHDENGRLIRCPIFNIGEYGAPPRSYPIVCDIDGDGRAELMMMREEVYGPLTIYGLQNGKLVFRYSIAISA